MDTGATHRSSRYALSLNGRKTAYIPKTCQQGEGGCAARARRRGPATEGTEGSADRERGNGCPSLEEGFDREPFFFQDIAQTPQCVHLDLPHPFTGDAQLLRHALQGRMLVTVKPETTLDHFALFVI